MTVETTLWILLFIMFLSVIWITILYRLQRIEKLLKRSRTTNNKGDSPHKERGNLKPKGING